MSDASEVPEVMQEYHRIQGKLNRKGLGKRFFRKATVNTAKEDLQSLHDALRKEGNLRYTAFVAMALARCEQSVHNTTKQGQHLVDAGDMLLECTLEGHQLSEYDLSDCLVDAEACYLETVAICREKNRDEMAAILLQELGNVMRILDILDNAAHYYQEAAAAHLKQGAHTSALLCLESAAEVFLQQKDLNSVQDVYEHMVGLSTKMKNKFSQQIQAGDELDGGYDSAYDASAASTMGLSSMAPSLKTPSSVYESLSLRLRLSLFLCHVQTGEFDKSKNQLLELVELAFTGTDLHSNALLDLLGSLQVACEHDDSDDVRELCELLKEHCDDQQLSIVDEILRVRL